MPKGGTTHDISILNSAGVEYGFMLAKKNGLPIYQETTTQALAPQTANDSPDYSKFPAEEELRAWQTDYRGGAGLEYDSGYGGNRYHYGVNADARFASQIRLGGLSTTVTKCDLPALVYAGADPLVAASADTDASNWTTAWRNKLITVTVTFYQLTGANKTNLYLNDGIGNIDTDATANTTGSKSVVLTGQVSATATRIRVTISAEAGVQDSSIAITVATFGTFTAQADFNSKHFISSGSILLSLDATQANLVMEGILPATITDLFASTVAGVDYLFICQGWSNDYYYMTAAGVFTLSTLNDNSIKYMVASSTTFYGADTNSTIRSTTNPINGGNDWTTDKQIGEDAFDIVDVKEYGGLIYAKKSDCKVYYIDSSGNVQGLITGQSNLAGTNTSRMCVWREEALIIPYGAQGLIHYDGSSVEMIQPALYMTGTSDFIGQVQAVVGDEQYLYVILDNSTKIEVMAVHRIYLDGVTDWRWHTLNEITLTNCASASISSIYKKRLWIASDTGSENLYYIPVTDKYGSIATDTNYTYQTGGYIVTPFYHMNLSGDKKAWVKLTLNMSGTTTNIYWRAYYKKLGDSSWTEINSTAKFKTSPQTVGYIPVDGSSNKPSTTMMQFKFEGVTNSTSTSPVLLGWDVQSIWYPQQREYIVCTVELEDNQLTRRRNIPDETLTSVKKAILDELYNPTTAYPRTMYSIDGTAKTVKAMPPKRAYLATYDPESDKSFTWRYDLVLECVKLT